MVLTVTRMDNYGRQYVARKNFNLNLHSSFGRDGKDGRDDVF
jgi:hypothetical protein